MHYGKIKNLDISNGEGVRVSLFVSGCRNRCKGCFQPETWDFNYGQEFDTLSFLNIDNMLESPNISGLSILGGDPFEPENRTAVELICEYVAWNHVGKSIWMWTGYLFEDLKDLPVMKYIDILVDGPYVEELRDLRLKWRGSSNQRVIDVQKSLEAGEVVLYCD